MRESAIEWVAILPWLLPVTAAFVVGAVWVRRPVARALGTRPLVAVGVLIALGIILGATLTPLGGAGDAAPTSGCDLSRLGLASLGDLRRLNDAALNVVLFIPLGTAIGLAARAPRAALLGGAVCLPLAIEAVQLAIPALGRGCQSADVIDNLTGLFVGVAGGYLALQLHRLVRRRSDSAPGLGHDDEDAG